MSGIEDFGAFSTTTCKQKPSQNTGKCINATQEAITDLQGYGLGTLLESSPILDNVVLEETIVSPYWLAKKIENCEFSGITFDKSYSLPCECSSLNAHFIFGSSVQAKAR